MEGEELASVAESIGNDLFGPSVETEIETPEVELEVKVPETQAETKEPIAEVKEGESVKEEVILPANAPKTWRKEALAAWETLPQVVKDEVAKREEDMFKGMEQYKQGAQIGDNFQRCITPHLEHLQRAGVNPYEEINGMLEYGKIMRFGTQGEKIQLLSSIIQEYNINALDLADHAASQPYVDPAIKALQTELNTLKSGRQQETSQRELQVQAENQARIDTFKSDPKHEHFSLLEPEMAAFISSGVSKTLEEAYEKALWANPVTRDLEQKRQTAELQAQSQVKVEAAKAAKAANLKTNARPGSATAPKGSMDDTLLATLANIRSR